MSVYLFTSYNIVNEQAYAPYVEVSLPILHKYGGEIFAADDQALVICGIGIRLETVRLCAW